MSAMGYLTIFVCAVLTFALRALPVVLVSRLKMSQLLRDWLGFVPAAIMSSLVAAELILKPELTPSGISISVLAAAIATVAGAITRSLFVTVLAGVGSFLALQHYLM